LLLCFVAGRYNNMPQVETLSNLCSLIYLTRQLDPPSLRLEEDLFRLLVEIYRSTEAIIVWTELDLLDPPEHEQQQQQQQQQAAANA
jgi:hypothetical protein